MSKLYLTTRECADKLGMSTDYVLGEIMGGRLHAIKFTGMHRKRAAYRIPWSSLVEYCDKYCPGLQLDRSA